MNYELKNAIESGKVIFKNVYETNRGVYLLLVVKHNEQFYIFKYKNRVLVFANNLNKMREISMI